MKQLVLAGIAVAALVAPAVAQDRVRVWSSADSPQIQFYVYPSTVAFDFENLATDASGVFEIVRASGATSRLSVSVSGCGGATGPVVGKWSGESHTTNQTWVRDGTNGWDASANYLCNRFLPAYEAARATPRQSATR